MNVNSINHPNDTNDASSIGSADDLIHRSLLRDRNSTRERGASVDSKSTRKSVRFRDGIRGGESYTNQEAESNSVTIDESGSFESVENPGLVDVAYFETLMKNLEPWGDHTYLPGFREIFTADEVTVRDSSCWPCVLTPKYHILNKSEEIVYHVRKLQGLFSTLCKTTCFRPFSKCRNGFKLQIFNLEGTLLVTFIRKTHYCATQLDIVETFYGKEYMYVGRIERSAHGYLLRDKDHEDIYRVLEIPQGRNLAKLSKISLELVKGSVTTSRFQSDCCSSSGLREMKIFRTDSKEVVGRVVYLGRSPGLRFLSGCLPQTSYQAAFRTNPDMGTNAKVLLIGSLFFLLHSKHDKFVALPLGPDAINLFDKESSTQSNSQTSI